MHANNAISNSISFVLNEKIRECEGQHRLYLPETTSLSKAVRYSSRRDSICSPWPRMFCFKEKWNALNPKEQYRWLVKTYAYLHPNWIFCDISAAVMFDLSISYKHLGLIHIAQNENGHGGIHAKVRKHAISDLADFEYCDEVLVTSLPRTVFECICRLNFVDGLALADSALHLNPGIKENLILYTRSHTKKKGIGNARKVIVYMSELAESGAESLARALMIEMGYREPELQVCFKDKLMHNKSYRVDMLSTRDDGTKVAIEIDGREKYCNEAMLNNNDTLTSLLNERQREAMITSYGIEVMRLRYSDLVNRTRFRELMELYRIPKER